MLSGQWSYTGFMAGRDVTMSHRRRIYTEEKAKVVSAVGGTEFIQFHAALAIVHKDDFEK